MGMQKAEFVRSFPCDTAITANKVVVASTANTGGVMLPAATTNLTMMGVTTADSDTRGWASVAMGGVVQVTAGGTIAKGDLLGFDTDGKAVAVTPAGGGTTLRGVIGPALSAASSGGLVDVAFHPSYCQV